MQLGLRLNSSSAVGKMLAPHAVWALVTDISLTVRHLLMRDAQARLLACALLGIDLLLIVMHFGLRMHGSQRFYLLLTYDLGVAETFNYMKIALLVGILLYIWRTNRMLIYLVWAIVFTVVGLDDSLMIHERVGEAFTRVFDLPRVPGLRVQDTGEMLTWLLLGAPLAGLIVVGFLRASPEHRAANAIIAMLLALLACFAIGADMVHVAAHGHVGSVLMTLLEIVEDGGEIVVVSLIGVYIFLLAQHPASFHPKVGAH